MYDQQKWKTDRCTQTSSALKKQLININVVLYGQFREGSLLQGFLRIVQTLELSKSRNQNYVLNSMLKGPLLVFQYQKLCKTRKCQNGGDLIFDSLTAKNSSREGDKNISFEMLNTFSPLLLSLLFFSPRLIIQCAVPTILLVLL